MAGLRASVPHGATVHGMYVDAALIRWRDEKRKWRAYLSDGAAGDYFIAEDRDRLPVRPRGKHIAHSL